MTVSDWGDWLPRAVATADPDTVSIWYLGCNGFVLKAREGTTLWIDPYVGLGDPPRTLRMIPVPFDPEDVTEEAVDAILATHEHTDHTHGPTQGPILENTGADFFAPDDSLAVAFEDEQWLESYDIDESQFTEVTEGDSIEIGAFEIDVVETEDADSIHPVGYMIHHESGTVFHAGDSKASASFPDLGEAYDIDLGILAFGAIGNVADKETGEPVRTKWYATENETIKSASDLQLDRLLPSHWDMWKGMTADPTVLHHHTASYEHPKQLEIVEIGDRVEL